MKGEERVTMLRERKGYYVKRKKGEKELMERRG